jgi:hypothetical protein
MSRNPVLVRLGITLGLAIGLLLATAAPASAGDAGRNCKTFYAQNNPASGWGFTVCVKLVHDASTHQWWATGSVSSTTSGIRLHVYDLFMNYGTSSRMNLDPASVSGSGSDFVAALTDKYRCFSPLIMSAFASGYAIWPNGVTSSPQGISTSPYETQGNC